MFLYLQDGQREDGDAAGAADHIKYAEQTDQVQKWSSQIQLFQINNNQGSQISCKFGSITLNFSDIIFWHQIIYSTFHIMFLFPLETYIDCHSEE